MKTRLILSKDNNAYYNMALDEALVKLSSLPVLRFYTWKPKALSLGFFQKISEINKNYCKINNIDLVRRITGGKGVLHDKELTYSFITSEKNMPKSVVESYKIISEPILKALNNLKVPAVFKEENIKKTKTPICLSNPSWYEITAKEKKIAAAAQKRINSKILQHGSILLEVSPEEQCRVFNNSNSDIIKRTKERITSIKNFSKNVTLNYLIKELTDSYKKIMNLELIKSSLTKEEKELTKKLIKEKYSLKTWTEKY